MEYKYKGLLTIGIACLLVFTACMIYSSISDMFRWKRVMIPVSLYAIASVIGVMTMAVKFTRIQRQSWFCATGAATANDITFSNRICKFWLMRSEFKYESFIIPGLLERQPY